MYLPDYMKALIQFHQNLSWDDLLVALDSAHPFVHSTNGEANHSSAITFKTEQVEVNTFKASQSDSSKKCFRCHQSGHFVRQCPLIDFDIGKSRWQPR